MKRSTEMTTLFLDVGGIMLSNGWGQQSRALAAKAFDLNQGHVPETGVVRIAE